MKNLSYERKFSGSNKYENGRLFNRSEVNDIEILLRKIKEPFFNTRKQLEKRQPIGQVITFGKALKALTFKHNCSFVCRYGEELVNAANGFKIEMIIKLLMEYPGLIRNIRQEPCSETEV
jgi:hypothetical protein